VQPTTPYSLKLTVALLAGLAFLGTPASARAGYIQALACDGPSAWDAAASDSSWGGDESAIHPGDHPSSPGEPRVDPAQPHLIPWALLGPSANTRDAGGMGGTGGTGGTDSGGSGQPMGLIANLSQLFAETSQRLLLAYTYHLPPPFASRLFHPPRADAA
jgi:hypothetical protein